MSIFKDLEKSLLEAIEMEKGLVHTSPFFHTFSSSKILYPLLLSLD